MPFVLLDEMHCLGGQIVRFCQQRECLPAVTCKTAQLLTVQHMVALGQGVSLVPELAAREDQSGSCRYVSLGADAPRRTIAMIRHKDRFRSELVSRFQDALRKSLP
jgi:LysR family hydrogen peroxide-inducible transcriptional activator